MRPHYLNPEHDGICQVGYKHGVEDMKALILSELGKLDPLTNIDHVVEIIKKL